MHDRLLDMLSTVLLIVLALLVSALIAGLPLSLRGTWC
jgi:hypothetical protein